MKKFLSVIFLLLTVFVFALSAVSCGESPSGECERHTDENGDGVCEVCDKKYKENGKENGSQGGDKGSGEEEEDKREMLADAVIRQLELAASAKLDFRVSISKELRSDAEPSMAIVNENLPYSEALIDCTLTVSKDEDMVNASLYTKIQIRDSKDGEFSEYFDGMALYLVDNMLYTRNLEKEIYYQKEVDAVSIAELTDAVRALLSDVSSPAEEQIEQTKDYLEQIFLEVFGMDGNNAHLLINATEPLGKLLLYLNGTDTDTKTLGAIISDALASCSAELTLSDITEKLYEILPLSVNEAIARLDAWLTEREGVTLGELYRKTVRNENVIQIIRNLMKLNGAAGEDINLTVDRLGSKGIYEVIEEYEIGEECVAGFLEKLANSLFGIGGYEDSATQSDSETAAKIRETVDSMLSMTLSELLSLRFSPEECELVKAFIAYARSEQAKSALTLTFSEGYNLLELLSQTHIDLTVGEPRKTEGGEAFTELYDYETECCIRIYDLSMKATEIIVDEAFR